MEPPEDSAPGDRVSVQGYEEEPDEQLNPKKKIFEQVAALIGCISEMHLNRPSIMHLRSRL